MVWLAGGREGAMGERRPRCFYRVNQGGFIRAGKSLDNNVTVRQTGQLLLLLEYCRPSLAVSSTQEESAEEHFHLLGQDNCNCDSIEQKVQFFLFLQTKFLAALLGNIAN